MGNCCGQEEPRDETDNPRNPRNLRRNVCCTDIIVLILFIAFWVFLLFIAGTAFIKGDPRRVVHGYDTSGNTCNRKNLEVEGLDHSGLDTSGKAHLFYFSWVQPRHTVQVCVEKCPNRTLFTKQDVIDFYLNEKVNLCQYGTVPSEKVEWSRKGPCPSLPVLASHSVLSRCLPKLSSIANRTQKVELIKQLSEMFKMQDFLSKAISDLTYCWRELLCIAVICAVIVFLMVLLLRFFAFLLVWAIVILSIIGSIVGTVLLWLGFVTWLHDDGSDPLLVPLAGFIIKKRTAFLVSAIIASVLTLILLFVIIVMRSRIGLVVALFKEAGKCLADIPLLLVQPFLTFIIYVIMLIYFIFMLACISTMGEPTPKNIAGVRKVTFEKSAFENQFWWIYLLGWLWTSEFILACQEFVISSAVATWYFSPDKDRLGWPILSSIRLLIVHHLGSIAFGSLVIGIVKAIKYVLMYIERNLKGSESDVAKACLKCCICCMWCLENILRFVHQNAYTVIAIQGTNFCTSARKAFSIITNNALRVAALNSVGDFVLFLAKLASGTIAAIIAYFWIKTISSVYYLGVPVALSAIFAFLIAHVFFSVYEMVVDALLLCFCEDSARNDGTDGREYFMSKSLMEFVTDSSAILEKGSKNPKSPKKEPVETTSLNDA